LIRYANYFIIHANLLNRRNLGATIMPSRRVAIALQIDVALPHHQEVFRGVRDYALEHQGWRIMIDEHPGYKSARLGRNAVRYDGVVARATPATQRRLKTHDIPLVNTLYQHARPDTPGVYIDAEAIGELAAEHLMERGFRRFGYFSPTEHRMPKVIGSAFARRVNAAGHSCVEDQFVNGDFDDRQYWQALTKHLTHFLDALTPPVGVFLVRHWVARLLVELCRDRGWLVPHDLALICSYDVKSVVDLPPRISTIDCNFERVGYEAAALLERLMAGEPPPKEPIFISPKGVIAQESTDYFAVEDEVVAAALRFIAAHIAERLTVDRIATEVAVSPRSLQTRFEAALGRPISDEIRRLRLTMAKRLLGEKGLQIKQIARETGFNTSVIMSHVFQREVGMSPSAYRKQVIGGKRPP
jgi:LacI family transcriptional regulator